MADANSLSEMNQQDSVAEYTSEAKEIEGAESEETKPDAKPTSSNLQDAFNDVLDNAVSKLWDERSRNKSKGKRKRLSKDEEKTLIGQLIDALSDSQNETESLQVMAKRLVQMVVENKTGEYKIDELTKRCSLLMKDKEDLNGQYKKSKLALTKLESLCRELQKHNRLMKEECDHRTKVEEAKRQELSTKFQSSIGEITNQMQDNHSKNQQLKTDNAELAAKLKGLVDQYEMREQYVDKVLKHKQIENQLLEAKLAQQTLILNEEREQALKEKQQLLQESLEYQKKCEQLLKDEAELKLQLSMYTEKFEEFQKTLTKSNEVFGTFKKEMDKMTKTIKKLEKETIMWKQKWEKSNQSLLELAGDNKRKKEQIEKTTMKNLKLENLCRALQLERKELSQKLESGQSSGEAVNSVEETSDSPVPMENGHSSRESDPKPEAEQAPGDTSDTGENSNSNSPTESESCIEVSLALSQEQVDCSECRECETKDSPSPTEGVGDERTEATEDEWHAESAQNEADSAENEANEEQECCEDDQPENEADESEQTEASNLE
ncbi:alpha-taxilin-like [Dendronephthya gigantea]|uniref:alpha-taxilin-like n=1 Tax=Dendronephthya gigantea TaxID=151771 RepID=UPI00106B12E8|nr:alpha-taxilin-like [Dendronephthya gigantea]